MSKKIKFIIFSLALLLSDFGCCASQIRFSRLNTLLLLPPVAISSATFGYFIAVYEHKKEMRQMFADSDDVAVFDPDLYELFLEIKKDFGIEENIAFRIAKPDKLLKEDSFMFYNEAYFKAGMTTNPHFGAMIVIPDRSLFHKNSRPYVMAAIAHELEHHRQSSKYHGSYADNYFDPDNSKKLECGADAAACGYICDCRQCLNSYGKNNKETVDDCFSTPKGYFAQKDIELYKQETDKPCKAHSTSAFISPSQLQPPFTHYLPRASNHS